jgi:DNA-binding response OmpR family regulator
MFHILIIEDEPAILVGLEALLKADNYEVTVCKDGKEGFTKALEEVPDAILLDISLPSLNGIDICRMLRENEFRNPIIMLTSRSEPSDRIVGLEIGADDYITKPFDTREVLARIRAQLRKIQRQEADYVNTENKSSEEYQRKLLSIMFTDIQDYSKIMNKNELQAIKLLELHNKIMNECINKAGGKIIEVIGDALLVSFESVLIAVNCAVNIQRRFRENNKAKPNSEKIKIRIGIHLGDVIEFEGKLKGDVLNVAARIQQSAKADSVFISDSVYNAIKNKTSLKIKNLGKHSVKNIQDPIGLYQIIL